MGIGIVLLIYLVFFSGLAAICRIILRAVTARYLRGTEKGVQQAVTLTGRLPFVCVLFAGLWFIAYAAINDVVFHHDPAIGDGWYTDVGNGYAIEMIDVTDVGFLRPIGAKDIDSPSAVQGVRSL